MNIIVERFNKIKSNLSNVKTDKNVKIIAISKTIPINNIQTLIDYGHNNFDENKVKEALAKWRDIKKIKQELLKGLHKPIYIPLISVLCCFLIIYSKNKINYKRNNNYIFFITFIILIISEASLRYSVKSEISLIIYLFIPLFLFIFAYSIFYIMVKIV